MSASKKSIKKKATKKKVAKKATKKKVKKNITEGQAFVVSTFNNTIITITDEGFLPSKIVIHRGVEVTFIQEGENLHWPASNMHPTHEILSDFDSLRPLKKGESWSFVFLKSGEWKFHDHFFPLHGGVIVVIDETQKELN